jgi:hypothetical protein
MFADPHKPKHARVERYRNYNLTISTPELVVLVLVMVLKNSEV